MRLRSLAATSSTLVVAIAGLVLADVRSLPVPASASAISAIAGQNGCRTFPETGKTVCDKFLQYWQAHGDLAQQGYPISAEFQEVSPTDGKTYTVQYFERAVFELHPENANTPYEVLLSLLGDFQYKQKYAYSHATPHQNANTSPGSVLFKETGRHLGGVFLAYWQSHGGLTQQGFPISDEFTEVSDLNGKPYTVQYFERAVFELHPENANTPYEVLLSQLGTFRHGEIYGTTGHRTDKWGIQEIFPTTAGGEEWFIDMSAPASDPRFRPQHVIVRNPDGSWKLSFGAAGSDAGYAYGQGLTPIYRLAGILAQGQCCPNEVRMNVFTSSGYNNCTLCVFDQQQLSQREYMQDPRDWKNVEMTGYVKLNATPSLTDTGSHFVWYNRGGRHIASNGCEGTGYKGAIGFDGRAIFDKEQWHAGGYSFTHVKPATTSLLGRWIGYKYVVYNFQQNGATVVKMESWLDDRADGHWVKIDENVDAGGWGDQGGQCGGTPDQIISWGGPIATFRWDVATDVDFRDLSVREIQPPLH